MVEAAVPSPTEERLGIVEGHLESVQTRLEGIEAQLKRMEALLLKRPMEENTVDSPAEAITNREI